MSQPKITNSEYQTDYTDISDKTIKVNHKIISCSDRKELEEKIVEELYRIFTDKVG